MKFTEENIQKLFGAEDAESEPIDRLKEFYLKNNIYTKVTANLPLRILVGHKGTGKSALFKVAISEEHSSGNLPILIRPDDIAELGKSDENFLLKIRQWKIGLTKIIGNKVLSEFGISDESNALSKFGVKLMSFVIESIKSSDKKISLDPTKKMLVQNFLREKKIVIYIDDLDRGWEGTKDDIQRISSLLSSLRDMANENEGLLFKISLRTDVYYLVRTSDESTDKIEGAVVWQKWSHQEIFVMLLKRILTYTNKSFEERNLLQTPQNHLNHLLDPIIDLRFKGVGNWSDVPMHKVLMSLIRKRPRDIVKLLSLAAHEAADNNSTKITSEHIQSILEEYSQGRIQDTINEYRSELKNIDKLLFGMRPSSKKQKTSENYVFTTSELHAAIRNCMNNHNFKLTSTKVTTEKELAHFLYKINFVTARKVLEDGTIQRFYFQENRYLLSSVRDFGYDWEIPVLYRWALQPDALEDIFHKTHTGY